MTRREAAGLTLAVAALVVYVAICEARGAANPQLSPARPTTSASPVGAAAEIFMDPSVHQEMAALEHRARVDMMLFAYPPPSPRLAIVIHGIAPPAR
jgi:hypothetical protein